jgi:undecaprenyl-diphosphatase
LKLTIRRPRPLPDSAATSFPSGHTIFIFILMGLLIYFLPLIIKNQTGRILCQLAAILSIIAMCFSRLYLQAHWLSDIISSLILVTLILIPAIMLYQKINKGKSNARTS